MATAAKSAAALGAEIIDIPLDRIIESEDNPRKHFDPAFVAQLAASLAEVGQITPALVRPHPKKLEYFELVAGATRFRAAKQAERPTLRCVVEPMDDVRFLKALTFENLKRRDLRPLEEARGYALLMKRLDGYTPEKIASESGVSVDYVRDRVRLLRLSERAQALLEGEEIELSHALELAKLNSRDEARAIAQGLFVPLRGEQQSTLVKLTGIPKRKAVTVHELRAWIDHHVLADLKHPDLAELQPETARLVATATAKMPQVFIATGYVRPEVKKGVEVLTPANWRRADGQGGSKSCDRPKKIGVVAAADAARAQAFLVCTSKACAVHFPEVVKRAAQRAKAEAKATTKGKAGPSAAERERLAREAQAKEQAAREAHQKAVTAALPRIREAIVAKILKRDPKTVLKEMIAAQLSGGWVPTAVKAAVASIKGDDLPTLVRRLLLATEASDFDAYRIDSVCKRYGVDLTALVKAEQKAAPAKKAGKPKAGTKAKSKAASRA